MNKHDLINSISYPVDKLGRKREAINYVKVSAVFNSVTKPERPSFSVIASVINVNPSTVERIAKKIKKAGYKIGKLRHNYNSHGYSVDMSDLMTLIIGVKNES